MIFLYKCKKNNEIIDGIIEANTMQDASLKLEAKDFIILELKPQASFNSGISLNYQITPLTIKEKKDFYGSFYRQYKSGISFVEIFNNMLAIASTNNIKTLCFNIIRKLQKENSVTDIFDYYAKYIGKTYAALVVAGDKSGKLENILEKIVQQVNTEEEIQNTIISKMRYPAIIFGMLFFSVCIFIFLVFPVFNQTIEGKSLELSSVLFAATIKILICFLIVGFLIYNIKKNKQMQRNFVNWILSLKFVSSALENYYFANFFTALSLNQLAGLEVCKAIELANKAINATIINQKIAKSQNMIQQGCEIATAFAVSGVFSDYAISQITTGEKSGELEKAYAEIALDYKQNYISKVDAILKAIEPTMTVVAGFFVLIVGIKMYSKYYETLFSFF